MRYFGQADHLHGSPACTGVLLTNLGTPDAPTPEALRRYLGEFLWDRRVIEMPRLLWWLILHGIVLRRRPKRAAAAYRKIWGEQGSPLHAISQAQAQALQQALERRFRGPVKVALGMRYGKPSIASALRQLAQANARRIVVLPLYPQYSATTTASSFDAVSAELQRWRWLPELRLINGYHADDGYLDALAASIRQQRERDGAGERLLFSFHGLPKRYLLHGDPYFCYCHETARRTAARLGLDDGQWAISFQSRFGREEWLKPYTDKLLLEWASDGVKRIDVVCPGFAADCLETLEEIAVENRDRFLAAGGEEYRYLPALNAAPAHIEALAELVLRHAAGWPEADPGWDGGAVINAGREARERALALGAER